MADDVRSIPQLARDYQVPEWRLRRLFDAGMFPSCDRVGNYRFVRVKDLPAVERVLRQMDLLPEPARAG